VSRPNRRPGPPAPRKSKPGIAGLPARRRAYDLLMRVLGDRITLDAAEESLPAELLGQDLAFARRLAATTLRRLGQLDAIINIKVTGKRPTPRVRMLLRLALAQLLFEAIPEHAVVATARALAEQLHERAVLGLITAIVKRTAAEAEALLAAHPPALNLPNWLGDLWREAWGAAETAAMVDQAMTVPSLDLTLKPDLDPEDWAGRLGATVLPGGTLRLSDMPGAVTGLPGFAEGRWWIQDWAASLPARFLGDVRGLRVLDLCAAPGGKTAQLAAAGARVTALDLSEARAARLRDNLSRLGLDAEIVIADALSWRPDAPFDAVLIDAPCSATGTWRKSPELPWIRKPEDLLASVPTQAAMLARAVTWLTPGGRLVYAVCSLQPEEGERQIDTLLANTADVSREPLTATDVANFTKILSPAGDMRSSLASGQQLGGMDGFFAARLRRGA